MLKSELESPTILGHFSLSQARMSHSYKCICSSITVSKLIPVDFTCFPVKIDEIISEKLVKFCFTTLHSSVFGEVRELVGEIKICLWMIVTMQFMSIEKLRRALTVCKFLRHILVDNQNQISRACGKPTLSPPQPNKMDLRVSLSLCTVADLCNL